MHALVAGRSRNPRINSSSKTLGTQAFCITPELRAELEQVFYAHNPDKSGGITADQVWSHLSTGTLTRDELDEMFRNADLDGSGKLEVDEFVRLMAEAMSAK